MRRLLAFGGLCLLLAALPGAAGGVRGHSPRLVTRLAANVTPDNVLPKYPARSSAGALAHLNGAVEVRVTDRTRPGRRPFPARIQVPFPAESPLSGLNLRLDWSRRLWYRRTFELPADWQGGPVLLHFGAVDWETTVWVNGVALGVHRGGYDSFSFDISAALRAEGPQEIVVAVWDPSESGYSRAASRSPSPQGIWYTPTTGIWQTVCWSRSGRAHGTCA
jgi:hypothetical protein